MQTKKEIIWNNETWNNLNNNKWIIDYETGTIYQEITISMEEKLPLNARVGDYYFKSFKGVLYFKTEKDKYYKVIDEQVIESSKEEYNEISNYRKINKKDPATLMTISTYVESVIIDDIMSKKFDLSISFPVNPPHLVNRFSKRFTPEVANEVKKIITDIVATMPTEVDRRTMKQEIKKIYKNITQSDEEFFKILIDNIYSNDKENFDLLSETILSNRNSKKVNNSNKR